jgi:hypothetical protein
MIGYEYFFGAGKFPEQTQKGRRAGFPFGKIQRRQQIVGTAQFALKVRRSRISDAAASGRRRFFYERVRELEIMDYVQAYAGTALESPDKSLLKV